MTNTDGLSATQLRAVADKLRTRYTPAHPAMTPGKYVSHETVNAFADALAELADEQDRA